MEVICINDIFSSEVLTYFNQFGVKLPVQDKIYNIDEYIAHTTGKIGVRLAEIENPLIPTYHPILGTIHMEPTFDINRFTNLLGGTILEEHLKDSVPEFTKKAIK